MVSVLETRLENPYPNIRPTDAYTVSASAVMTYEGDPDNRDTSTTVTLELLVNGDVVNRRDVTVDMHGENEAIIQTNLAAPAEDPNVTDDGTVEVSITVNGHPYQVGTFGVVPEGEPPPDYQYDFEIQSFTLESRRVRAGTLGLAYATFHVNKTINYVYQGTLVVNENTTDGATNTIFTDTVSLIDRPRTKRIAFQPSENAEEICCFVTNIDQTGIPL